MQGWVILSLVTNAGLSHFHIYNLCMCESFSHNELMQGWVIFTLVAYAGGVIFALVAYAGCVIFI